MAANDKEAAKRLAQDLAGRASVFSVGVGEERGQPILIVYLSSSQPRYTFPSYWEGFPVRTEYIGRVRPLE